MREFILTRGTKSKFLAPSSGAGPLNYDYCTYGTFGGTDSHHPHGLGRQFDNLWKRHELAKALKLSLSLVSAHLHLGSSQVKRLALRNPARSWKLWFAYIAVPEDWIKEQNQRQQIWVPGGQVFTLFLSKNVHSFYFFGFLLHSCSSTPICSAFAAIFFLQIIGLFLYYSQVLGQGYSSVLSYKS